jgi:asparagine synthase (glutamine-hydrolysing)
VVAMMAGQKSDPVSTFSISFGTQGWDESAFSREVAERYGTDHHVRAVDPNSFDLLDRLATIYDEPFGDSSAMPTFRVCAAARENVTVALSGDGGDEVFAGYRRYRWHCFEERVRGWVPEALRRPLFGLLGAVYPKLDWAPRPLRAKATLEELARNSIEAYFSSVSICNDALRRRLFSPNLRRELQGYHAADLLKWHICDATARTRYRRCSMPISRLTSQATSSPKSIAQAWLTPSKCAFRCSTILWSNGQRGCHRI